MKWSLGQNITRGIHYFLPGEVETG